MEGPEHRAKVIFASSETSRLETAYGAEEECSPIKNRVARGARDIVTKRLSPFRGSAQELKPSYAEWLFGDMETEYEGDQEGVNRHGFPLRRSQN